MASPLTMATRVSVTLVACVLGVQLLVPGGWGGRAQLVMLVGLLAGLPHGAVDHLVPGWVGNRIGVGRMIALLAGYAAAALGAYAAFRVAPLPALVIFIALSLWHFGAGEAQFSALRDGSACHRGPLTVVAYGGVTTVLPLVAWPEQVAPLLSALVPGITFEPSSTLRFVAVGVILSAAVVTTVRQLSNGHRRDALELVLLSSLFLLVTPLAAFGVFFGGWHSVRHVGRLLALNPGNASNLARGRGLTPLIRFLRDAMPTTGVSLIVLVCLWASAGGLQGFVANDLVLLAGLTVPHLATVAWLDRHRSRPA